MRRLAWLSQISPPAALVVVAAGLGWATREHLAVALALGVPAFVALTKADMVDESALDCLVQDVRWGCWRARGRLWVGVGWVLGFVPRGASSRRVWHCLWPGGSSRCRLRTIGLSSSVSPAAEPAQQQQQQQLTQMTK